MNWGEFLAFDLTKATVSASEGTVTFGGYIVRLWPPLITPDDEEGWALARLIAEAGAGSAAFPAVAKLPKSVLLARNLGQNLALDWVLFFAASPMAANFLVSSSPVLAWLAVRNRHTSSHITVEETIAHYRSLLCLSRRELLCALHLTPSTGLLKVLSRCTRECASDICMNELLMAVEPVGHRRWSAKLLFTLKRITPDALTLIKSGREFVGSRLMQRTQTSVDHEVTWLVQNAKAIWQERNQPYPWKDLSYDELATAIKRRQLRDELTSFPAPPFPSGPNLAPITSPRALFEEGCSMRNCVFSMRERVSEGNLYFYHVVQPPHTFAITRADHLWSISEIRGPGNQRAVEGVVEDCGNWLAAAQGVLPADVIKVDNDPFFEEGL